MKTFTVKSQADKIQDMVKDIVRALVDYTANHGTFKISKF